MIGRLGPFLRDETGAVVIETAFVVPILALMALGAFDVSGMVSRQVELQTSLAEASEIALSAPPENDVARETLKEIIKTSTGLGDGQVTIAPKYRCGTEATMVDNPNNCTTDYYASFVQITLTDTYLPTWTNWGVGGPLDYNVQRTIQVG